MDKDMIGLSLSFCVADILAGKVPVERVRFIVSGTKITDTAVLEEVVSDYSKTHWQGFDPADVSRLVSDLWFNHKIIQPRLISEDMCPNISNGHWAMIGTWQNIEVRNDTK
jgi:hypothetical protein